MKTIKKIICLFIMINILNIIIWIVRDSKIVISFKLILLLLGIIILYDILKLINDISKKLWLNFL